MGFASCKGVQYQCLVRKLALLVIDELFRLNFLEQCILLKFEYNFWWSMIEFQIKAILVEVMLRLMLNENFIQRVI
jgi:hypothetical protein